MSLRQYVACSATMIVPVAAAIKEPNGSTIGMYYKRRGRVSHFLCTVNAVRLHESRVKATAQGPKAHCQGWPVPAADFKLLTTWCGGSLQRASSQGCRAQSRPAGEGKQTRSHTCCALSLLNVRKAARSGSTLGKTTALTLLRRHPQQLPGQSV